MRSKYAIFRLGITILSVIVSVSVVRSIWEHRGKGAFVGSRQEVLVKEQARNAALQEKLLEATSPAFIEKQAREKLGLARPEDTIVLMVAPEGSGSAAIDDSFGLSNLQRWWKLFF